MKFAVVVVLLALALGANCSVVPLISSIHAPAVLAAPAIHGSVEIQASAVPAAVAVAPAHPVQIVSSPAVIPAVQTVVAAPAHPVVAVAPVEGTYVAKTRGAIHLAPLPGHAHSAASVNLQPAPGTL